MILLWQIAFSEETQNYYIKCLACGEVTTYTKEFTFDSGITVKEFLTGCECHNVGS